VRTDHGGGIECWGYNGAGQLGDGTTRSRRHPVGVVGLGSGVASVSAGSGFTCAVTEPGGAMCWGNNVDGGLGDGSFIDRRTPVGVVGLAQGVRSIAAGVLHTCALLDTDGVRCWGYNEEGQLGDGTTFSRPVPISTRAFRGVPAHRSRPDAMIARSRTGLWVGDDVYDRTGTTQTLRVRLAEGEARILFVRAQNDAARTDHLYLEGTRGTDGMRVLLSMAGTRLTSSVVLGRRWVELQPEGSALVAVRIRAARDAPLGPGATLILRARAAGDCRKVDAVRVIVSVGV
jgi:hypothetical protein